MQNIVWAWSPNLSDEKTVEKFLERFPGEKYVDMLGVDVYEFDNSDANYQQNLAATLDALMEAAKKVGKISSPKRVAGVSPARRIGLSKPFGLYFRSIS